jgi:ribosome-associated translation inhibitor RaiA
MKVTINGVEIEVPDVAVNHFNSRIDDLTSTNTHLENAQQVLQTSLIEVTTERDTMAGALAVAQATLETTQATVVEMKNNAPDVSVEAARIANEHAAFVLEAQRLNHADELVLGAYERDAVMLTVLNARGAQFADTTNTDTLKGAWTFALANADTTTRSVLDPAPGKTVAPLANVSAGATAAVNASYFGGKKKETK